MQNSSTASPRCSLVIPTCNAGPDFPLLLCELAEETLPLVRRLVIDTSSTDRTAEIARAHGCEVITITPEAFGHGRTRQLAFEHVAGDSDAVFFLTQDVRLPARDALARLRAALFADERNAAAYGRQLPKPGASAQTRIERAYSYPAQSRRKTLADARTLGLRAPFLSDAFAIYRTAALHAIGGFPDVSICEDIYVGARFLLAGHAIAYAADACVQHSHELTPLAACRRYRAMGAFHRAEPWIRRSFGGSGAQGLRVLCRQMLAAPGPVAAAGTAASYALRAAAFYLGCWSG